MESEYTARYREFESPPLRHVKSLGYKARALYVQGGGEREPTAWLVCGERKPERCPADSGGRRDREAGSRPRKRKPTRVVTDPHVVRGKAPIPTLTVYVKSDRVAVILVH